MKATAKILLVPLIATLPAHAAPLEPAACDALKIEFEKVATADLKTDFAKGAEWSKANLSPERLKDIQKLLELQEQLAFRCPQPKPALAPNVGKEVKIDLDLEGVAPDAEKKTPAKTKAEKPEPDKKKVQTKSKFKAKTSDAAAPAEGATKPPTKPQ